MSCLQNTLLFWEKKIQNLNLGVFTLTSLNKSDESSRPSKNIVCVFYKFFRRRFFRFPKKSPRTKNVRTWVLDRALFSLGLRTISTCNLKGQTLARSKAYKKLYHSLKANLTLAASIDEPFRTKGELGGSLSHNIL